MPMRMFLRALIGIITKAEKCAVLVSPYLDLWEHLHNAIKLAVKRGVEFTPASQAWDRPSASAASTGFCIRCEETWPFGPNRPLCDGCYDV